VAQKLMSDAGLCRLAQVWATRIMRLCNKYNMYVGTYGDQTTTEKPRVISLLPGSNQV
jgi:hypothetical protein